MTNIVTLGDVYTDSSVNVSIFRQNALLTTPSGLLVGYYDSSGDVRIKLLSHKGQLLGQTKVAPRLENRLLADGHCIISLGVSTDQRVHVLYGAHATHPYYATFTLDSLTDSIADSTVSVADPWTLNLTYPQFFLVDDHLKLLYRIGGDYYFSDYSAGQWSFPEQPLVIAANTFSAYLDRMAVQGRNLALPLVFRLRTDQPYAVKNAGIYLVLSSDSGQTWHDIKGNLLIPPLQQSSMQKLPNTPLTAGLMNQNSAIYGPEGLLYLAYQQQDQNEIPQIFLSVIDLESGTLETEQVSNSSVFFSLGGKGTLRLPLSRPDIAVSKHGIYVLYRQGDALVIAKKTRSWFGRQQWGYLTPKVPALGVWEPNYDLTAWTQKGTLVVYIQKARQGSLDRALKGECGSGFLYKFEESF